MSKIFETDLRKSAETEKLFGHRYAGWCTYHTPHMGGVTRKKIGNDAFHCPQFQVRFLYSPRKRFGLITYYPFSIGLGASGKWMMVRMVTIIHLSKASAQPAVYMIQLGGTSPWSLQWGDRPWVRLGRALRQGPVGPIANYCSISSV